MPQAAPAITTPAPDFDPFEMGGRNEHVDPPSVTAADLYVMRTAIASLWQAGGDDKFTCFVLTVPAAFAERLLRVIENDPYDDIESIVPDDHDDEKRELDILFKAFRERDRLHGALEYADRARARARKEEAAARLVYHNE